MHLLLHRLSLTRREEKDYVAGVFWRFWRFFFAGGGNRGWPDPEGGKRFPTNFSCNALQNFLIYSYVFVMLCLHITCINAEWCLTIGNHILITVKVEVVERRIIQSRPVWLYQSLSGAINRFIDVLLSVTGIHMRAGNSSHCLSGSCSHIFYLSHNRNSHTLRSRSQNYCIIQLNIYVCPTVKCASGLKIVIGAGQSPIAKYLVR